MDVVRALRTRPRAEQAELTCHAEMDHQDSAVLGDDRELLAPAIKGVHRGTLEDGVRAGARPRLGFADVRAKKLCTDDAAADERGQAPANGFDLGKLGHGRL